MLQKLNSNVHEGRIVHVPEHKAWSWLSGAGLHQSSTENGDDGVIVVFLLQQCVSETSVATYSEDIAWLCITSAQWCHRADSVVATAL